MSSTALTAPAYSTRELRAAAAALADGRFSGSAPTAPTSDDRAAQPAPPRKGGQQTPQEATSRSSHTVTDPMSAGQLAPLVRVRAGNSGAGASTIALALADAADAVGVRARVLDAAAPAWSGLLGATVTEMGAAAGWRRGRRGAGMLIDRVQDPIRSPDEVPRPRTADGVGLHVLDVGWSMRELAADSASRVWLATQPARAEVLVIRPHCLGLSQAEAALAALEEALHNDQVVVVVVGATRWSSRAMAAAGRRLHAAHEQNAVLFAPLLSATALSGLGPDPLPPQLTKPAQRLLDRANKITGPLITGPLPGSRPETRRTR